jgi:AAA lid domain-containing protein/KAP-like P-loop domain-containing protein/ClpA/ClpB-like protein/ATPase family protein associated with various cellular activities (AAA)
MFERFTDRARRVVVLSREEARTSGRAHIDTEHLLLALIDEGEGVGAKALLNLGVSLDAAREEIASLGGQAEPVEDAGSLEESVEEVDSEGTSPSSRHIPFTPRARNAISLSLNEALQAGHDYIGTEHILLGLIHEGEGVAAQVLVKLGADLDQVRRQVSQLLGGYWGKTASAGAPAEGAPANSLELDQFGRNLTQAARQAKLDPVTGREKEIERVMQVLSRRTKNNPVLIGEPGVGKTAIVEGLAQAIVRGDVPGTLKNKQIYTLDAEFLETATSEPADVETRLRKALQAATMRADIVLFVEDLHVLLRAGAGRVDTASILRPLLSGGYLQTIGGMTFDDYNNYLKNDEALEGLFQPIPVAEPTVAQTVEILKGVLERYESHHRVIITDAALVAAAELAHRYITDRFLPESAIDLIDEAGARMGIRRMTAPPDLREFDERIATVRREKESAIDAQDFERAAALRDDEKQLINVKAEREKQWKAGELYRLAEVDQELIIDIVAGISGAPADKVRNTLSEARSAKLPVSRAIVEEKQRYVIIADQPVDDPDNDLLGTAAVAEGIASILDVSRTAAPFVLAVDGGWGTGKSTLLHQIESFLPGPPDMVKVRFNAWTAQGENALEGLIKSVLVELDGNLVRRWARRVAKRRRVVGVARFGFALVARFLGIGRLVDELMDRLSVDAQSRNELRCLIHGMLSDWVSGNGKHQAGRALVVFIDDLDRCDDDVIVGVCEGVKLYLDAPGLIFVIGCDLSLIARGVSGPALGGESEGRVYLEKIIQVVHRIPVPDKERIRNLIRGYSERSGTSSLIDDTVADLLAERTGRNPRRIKRIINSFVLEHHLNPGWRRPPLGSAQLITAILLQHLYPQFYDRLVSEESGNDPIGELLDYADVQAKASDPPPSGDAWWAIVSRTFRAHGMAPPERSSSERSRLVSELERLERWLPEGFPTLARNDALIALLRGVGDTQTRLTIRSQLMSRPLGTEALSDGSP